MKNTITKTMLSTIIALLLTAISTFSQNKAFSAVQNMGATLNTASNETGPVISPNGLSLYFTSDRGQGGNDIYVSKRAAPGEAWGAPQNLGTTVNSSSNDNVTGFSLDGRSMLLTSNRSGSMNGSSDIYVSTRTNPNDDFGWSAPVNLGATVNSAFLDNSGNFFEDPASGTTTLLFASDRLAMNGLDLRIYQSTRNPDGTFNAPALVNELNGEGGHFGIGIRPDGLEIFIGSARPGGLNLPAFDLYTSTRTSVSAPWSTPVLVAAVNSTADDRLPKLSPDGAILYFHSNRAGGFGGNDLYSATRCSIYAVNTPCTVNRSNADFDGDGRSDLSVFRPSDGTWWVMPSGTNAVNVQRFGTNGDKIVPGDYDGDGRTDLAVFRAVANDGVWYILRSSDSSFQVITWGLNTDKPVPADYDGDGRTDIAVFRGGTWYIRQSSQNGNPAYANFGLSSDIPVAGANVQ